VIPESLLERGGIDAFAEAEDFVASYPRPLPSSRHGRGSSEAEGRPSLRGPRLTVERGGINSGNLHHQLYHAGFGLLASGSRRCSRRTWWRCCDQGFVLILPSFMSLTIASKSGGIECAYA